MKLSLAVVNLWKFELSCHD